MAKRSCDCCVRRKTKCDNGQPSCGKCISARPPLECTYLNPVLKRGPKTSKLARGSVRRADTWAGALRRPYPEISRSDGAAVSQEEAPRQVVAQNMPDPVLDVQGQSPATFLLASTLTSIIDIYNSRMYPVWPVVDAPGLISRLNHNGSDGLDVEAYILATALCAATMAQLSIPSVQDARGNITSADMERECSWVRIMANYREHPSVEGVLASFFLHVYHAKIDHRNASIMFLQEAISFARILHLDEIDTAPQAEDQGFAPSQGCYKRLIYLLLWVSERGYAFQFNLPISIRETIDVPAVDSDNFDVYEKGLIELASLFAAFDASFHHAASSMARTYLPTSEKEVLMGVHESLVNNSPRSTSYNLVQRMDYNITKQWMRIQLWQQSMARGLLSSTSDADSMTFTFPSKIAQDLLASMTKTSRSDLMPLGRDQLIKSFEVTNTLADVILCTTPDTSSIRSPTPSHKSHDNTSSRECCRYGPADFLHGLFQMISPFLEEDRQMNDMLRQKAAEALLRSPNRLIAGTSTMLWENKNTPEGGVAEETQDDLDAFSLVNSIDVETSMIDEFAQAMPSQTWLWMES